MANAPLTDAERARLAHQALRLREAGVDSERKLRELAATAPAARILGVHADGEQRVQLGAGNPHAGIALEVVSRLEPELPGATAPDEAKRLMAITDLTSLWQEWDDAVTANLEATLDAKALKAWRDSIGRDRKAAQDAHAAVEARGEFPVHPAFGHMRAGEGAANALYDFGREGFLRADIDADAVWKVVLVDSADYAVNLATHQFLSSVASIGRVATSGALTTKTTAAGVFDADDVTMAAVTGDPSEALVVVQSSAVGGGADVADTAQRLVGYIDTATGLPVTPNGGDITVTWDNGANRIFKL